jgi:hypothetical protein
MREIKKLRLSRETIRNLDADALRRVVAGGPSQINQCKGDSTTCFTSDAELCAPTWATTCGTGYNC